MHGGEINNLRQCPHKVFQFVREVRSGEAGKFPFIFAKSNVTVRDRKFKSFFHKKFAVMGKEENSGHEYGRRILRVVFGFVQYVFQIFFGLVYRGNKECMPPIKDLLLLESASTIAMKIRSGKVSLVWWLKTVLTAFKDTK